MVALNRIRDLREDRDLRQIDVAKATGIDQKTLSNYETGKTNPDSYAIIKLCDFFGTSADYLIGRTDEKSERIDEIKRKICDVQRTLNEILSEMNGI